MRRAEKTSFGIREGLPPLQCGLAQLSPPSESACFSIGTEATGLTSQVASEGLACGVALKSWFPPLLEAMGPHQCVMEAMV